MHRTFRVQHGLSLRPGPLLAFVGIQVSGRSKSSLAGLCGVYHAHSSMLRRSSFTPLWARAHAVVREGLTSHHVRRACFLFMYPEPPSCLAPFNRN